ncbi:MAG TPA: polyprenyl synthetase family protein [Candidatus Avalokitesvara rifleensis]|uniref:polyprenyl synthetase family protein n=1 Tax=Candidatus Avalokitesvara rifleensis TaxID=3367620 RepID=UPI0027143899|nr:polyprenyl synthetase family protein [Candidatus Brocadiales bacterium]
MGIEESLKKYGKGIDEHLKKLFPVRDDYLSEPIWYHMDTGGKRMRPALCLIVCEALGGNPDEAVPFAAAVEILHNMFLMHDDIEDGDTVRRDKPAVWVKYGTANAINAGDYLLGRAYRSILDGNLPHGKRLRLLDIFTLTYEKTVEGQALDINWRGSTKFTIEDYLRTVELKTAYYLTCGMVGGAVIAGASDGVIDKIWELGKSMGPAFQIRDDLIDLTVGKGRGGVIGSDIKEGKPSFLYAYTLSKAGAADKERLVEIMLKPRESTSSSVVDEVIRLYKKYDAINYSQRFAEGLVEKAFKAIEEIPVENKATFREIAQFMAQRTA